MALGGAEIEAAALQFCVVAALALFGEDGTGVLLEEFELGRSLCLPDAEAPERIGAVRRRMVARLFARSSISRLRRCKASINEHIIRHRLRGASLI